MRQVYAFIAQIHQHIHQNGGGAALRRDQRRSSCSDALLHPLVGVGFQPDDRVRTDGDLLGEGVLSHPSVDGCAIHAKTIDDFRDTEEVCSGFTD